MQGHSEQTPADLLRRLTGGAASFREGQLDAIEALVDRRQRVLCVQRTGWGKSAVYFISTRLLRAYGAGPTVLISPLISLMRNQVAATVGIGIEAATINTATRAEWDEIFDRIENDEVDLLLISPERLNNPGFRTDVLPGLIDRIGLLVVDEAHCISDWGHDFRPDYRRIARLIEELPRDAAVLCTTATANNRVIDDVKAQLGATKDLITIRGSLDRPALRLEVIELAHQAERLAWLATHLPNLPGSGIVYCLTVRDAEMAAQWLRSRGIEAAAYSGQADDQDRVEIEDRLLRNEIKAVVATSALGMGYDKPDLGFVVHFQRPASPIAYYQQVGRAGRQIAEAHAVLLSGSEDREIQDYFIDVAFPPADRTKAVVDALGHRGGPMRVNELLSEVNISKGRLEAMLRVLEVDGAVRREGTGFARTEAPWAYDSDRANRVTQVRREEQAAMEHYAGSHQCLMQFLRQQLDDPDAEPCGRCAVCTAPRFNGPLDTGLIAAAVDHIRHRAIAITPRKMWPHGSGLGRIPEELRTEEGRALSRYADAGWGDLVRDGKFRDDHFSDELVEASAQLILGWEPKPSPEWVTAVPSLRRPTLVSDFAVRLANRLELPFSAVVRKSRDTRPQRAMLNSQQQAANVQGAFGLEGEISDRPLLLVDDMVDSGWTIGVVGALLRDSGAGQVHPFVLASTSARL